MTIPRPASGYDCELLLGGDLLASIVRAVVRRALGPDETVDLQQFFAAQAAHRYLGVTIRGAAWRPGPRGANAVLQLRLTLGASANRHAHLVVVPELARAASAGVAPSAAPSLARPTPAIGDDPVRARAAAAAAHGPGVVVPPGDAPPRPGTPSLDVDLPIMAAPGWDDVLVRSLHGPQQLNVVQSWANTHGAGTVSLGLFAWLDQHLTDVPVPLAWLSALGRRAWVTGAEGAEVGGCLGLVANLPVSAIGWTVPPANAGPTSDGKILARDPDNRFHIDQHVVWYPRGSPTPSSRDDPQPIAPLLAAADTPVLRHLAEATRWKLVPAGSVHAVMTDRVTERPVARERTEGLGAALQGWTVQARGRREAFVNHLPAGTDLRFAIGPWGLKFLDAYVHGLVRGAVQAEIARRALGSTLELAGTSVRAAAGHLVLEVRMLIKGFWGIDGTWTLTQRFRLSTSDRRLLIEALRPTASHGGSFEFLAFLRDVFLVGDTATDEDSTLRGVGTMMRSALDEVTKVIPSWLPVGPAPGGELGIALVPTRIVTEADELSLDFSSQVELRPPAAPPTGTPYTWQHSPAY